METRLVGAGGCRVKARERERERGGMWRAWRKGRGRSIFQRCHPFGCEFWILWLRCNRMITFTIIRHTLASLHFFNCVTSFYYVIVRLTTVQTVKQRLPCSSTDNSKRERCNSWGSLRCHDDQWSPTIIVNKSTRHLSFQSFFSIVL